jgi:O-antigen/teichoic acid export membrane protein
MAESRTRNSIINASFGMIGRLVTLILAFVVRSVFINTLGIQYAGISGVFTDVLTVLSFAELGIGTAVLYSLYKPIAVGDIKRINVFVKFYKQVYGIISAVIALIGISLIPFLGYIIKDVPDVKEDIRLIYILYIINTAVSYLFIYKTAFLTAAQKDYVVSKYKIIVSIIKTVVECILLLVYKNFIIYFTFDIIVVFLQNYIISLKANKLYPFLKERTKESLSKADRKEMFKNVRALMLYKVSGVVLNGTDSIVISSFINTSWVGIVGNYNIIINQLQALITQIFTSITASVGNLVAVESKPAQYAVFKKIFFISFWIYCFCASCLWALINPFVILWLGKERTISNAIVLVLIIEFYIKGMQSPITTFRTSCGLFVQGKYRPLIMALINITVSVILVQIMGITGVILGTIISQVSTQFWYDPYLVFKEVFDRSLWAYMKRYIVYFSVTVCCCISSQALSSLIILNNLYLNFVCRLFVCAILPNIIILLLFHRTNEFKEVMLLVKNVVRRFKSRSRLSKERCRKESA